jgi:hypothetical protein
VTLDGEIVAIDEHSRPVIQRVGSVNLSLYGVPVPIGRSSAFRRNKAFEGWADLRPLKRARLLVEPTKCRQRILVAECGLRARHTFGEPFRTRPP